MEKICNKCKNIKLLSEFSPNKRSKDKLNYCCKSCAIEYVNKDRLRKEAGLEPLRETKSKMYGGKGKNPEYGTFAQFKYKYGITIEDYNRKLETQEGKCKICGKHQSIFNKRMHLDHCHLTGKIRDILCKNCNQGLGHFMDNPELLEKAASYIKNHTNK